MASDRRKGARQAKSRTGSHRPLRAALPDPKETAHRIPVKGRFRREFRNPAPARSRPNRPPTDKQPDAKIGRATCRERVPISVDAASVKQKMKRASETKRTMRTHSHGRKNW